jgi:carboxylesterase
MNQPPAEGIKDHSFYYEGGDAGVLLIHGLTGTPVEMRFIGKGLHKAGFTVYGVQLPGHCGNEADLLATGWQDWVAGVERALLELSSKVRTVFVGGLSMGAILSLRMAALHPDKVSGLLLYGPTLSYDGWTIPWYSDALRVLIYTPFGDYYRFMEKPPYGIKDERLRRRVVHNMLNGNSADAGLAGTPARALQQMWKLSAQVRKDLPSIQTPALIQHAREDDVSNVRNAYYIARHLAGPVDVSLLEDSYHMITVDRQRDQVLARSIEHLQRWCVQAEPRSGNLRIAAVS